MAARQTSRARFGPYSPAQVRAAFEHDLGYELRPIQVGGITALSDVCPSLPYAIFVATYPSVSAASAAYRRQWSLWHYSGFAARRLANVIVNAARPNTRLGDPGRPIPMPAPALQALRTLASGRRVDPLHRRGRICPATS